MLHAWLKSTATGFYEIDYAWRKGGHPKRGKFSPDFFLNIAADGRIVVVEIKDDGECDAPASENIWKNAYAIEHFRRLNAALEDAGIPVQYAFHFLTPRDYGDFFSLLREGRVADFRSRLDVKLAEELQASIQAG